MGLSTVTGGWSVSVQRQLESGMIDSTKSTIRDTLGHSRNQKKFTSRNIRVSSSYRFMLRRHHTLIAVRLLQ